MDHTNAINDKPFSLQTTNRWTIIAQDDKKWRVGIYHPEFSNPDDIDVLEKHSCPELFICCNAPCGLLLMVEGQEEIHILNPNEAIFVTQYHNGFKVDVNGYFIVVEQTDFTTEFIERKSR
ncbi:MAG: hypothetical protein N3F66_00680 [Spirochaetes bacterium]|nr:hypothetical protein [Spirochaetota bacterium]